MTYVLGWMAGLAIALLLAGLNPGLGFLGGLLLGVACTSIGLLVGRALDR